MKKISKSFVHRNIQFDLVKRNAHACIYSISFPENSYKLGYEVHLIKISPERDRNIFGKVVHYSESEIISGDAEFGSRGWDYRTLKNAERKFLSVTKRLNKATK